jgi:hypothetical protein
MKAIEAFIVKSDRLDLHKVGGEMTKKDSRSANGAADQIAEKDSRSANGAPDQMAEKDSRSADMKRADALTAIAGFALASKVDEVALHRRPITINVTIDLPTLLGLSENPGQLAGYGAIPASVARALASDGKWRRFITDPLEIEHVDSRDVDALQLYQI